VGSPIECTNLRKTYDGKVEAVRGISLRIEAGQCFGLLGPNGAGKTTTIEILEGLLAPSSGEVRIFGHTWNDNPRQLREWIGISLQETRLSEKLSVRETIELFASFYSEPRPAAQVLEDLELTEKADAWVGKLSGGQLPRHWLATRVSFFLTSRQPDSIPKAAASSGTLSASSRKKVGPSSSPLTTWTRPNASATASPSSITARSSPKALPPTSSTASAAIMWSSFK
jgi:hypothetical protein